MGKKLRIKKTNIFHGNTSIRCPNIKKIKKLGFRQKVKLNRGIDLIVKNQKSRVFAQAWKPSRTVRRGPSSYKQALPSHQT